MWLALRLELEPSPSWFPTPAHGGTIPAVCALTFASSSRVWPWPAGLQVVRPTTPLTQPLLEHLCSTPGPQGCYSSPWMDGGADGKREDNTYFGLGCFDRCSFWQRSLWPHNRASELHHRTHGGPLFTEWTWYETPNPCPATIFCCPNFHFITGLKTAFSFIFFVIFWAGDLPG